MDFVHDSLYCGKRFRILNIIDEGTRECLAIEVNTSLPAERVIRVLERLKIDRGLPKQIRVDNDSGLIPVNLLNYYVKYEKWCGSSGKIIIRIALMKV